MARVARVTRVANPRRGRGKARSKRRNPRHRRRLTAKQIKFFGTKAQKAGLKRRRKHATRSVARKTNPRRKRRTAARPVAHRRRRSATRNPALVVTLGAVNPKRRKTQMAKRRRKSNPRRRVAARRRNTAIVTRSRRVGVRRRRTMHRRRNPGMPSFFGGVGGRGLATTIAGGLLGVTAAKLIPGLVPAGILPISGGWMKVVVTGVSAWAAGTAAAKFVGPAFGNAVMFGGFMQTGSQALNLLLPNFTVGGVPLALSGMGELMPGQFPVPQNPLRLPAPVPTQARVTMNGLARSFGVAL